jgi:hypothetical protein
VPIDTSTPSLQAVLLLHELTAATGEAWTLVVPPLQYPHTGEKPAPWRTLFDMQLLRTVVPAGGALLELAEYYQARSTRAPNPPV